MKRERDGWIVIVVGAGLAIAAVLAGFGWVFVLGSPSPYRLACGLAHAHPGVWRLLRCA
jgi:hypothetical protein